MFAVAFRPLRTSCDLAEQRPENRVCAKRQLRITRAHHRPHNTASAQLTPKTAP